MTATKVALSGSGVTVVALGKVAVHEMQNFRYDS